MKTTIVYNPKATGFNKDVLNRAYANFRNQGMTVQTFKSTFSGKLPELVKKANKESDIIVTLGGDGTLGEAFEAFPSGKLYKYVVGLTDDPAEAKKTFARIKDKFPGSFLVKIENGIPARTQ